MLLLKANAGSSWGQHNMCVYGMQGQEQSLREGERLRLRLHLLPVGCDDANFAGRHLAGEALDQLAAVAHDLNRLGSVEPGGAFPFPGLDTLCEEGRGGNNLSETIFSGQQDVKNPISGTVRTED